MRKLERRANIFPNFPRCSLSFCSWSMGMGCVQSSRKSVLLKMQKTDYVPKWSPQVWEQKPGYLHWRVFYNQLRCLLIASAKCSSSSESPFGKTIPLHYGFICPPLSFTVWSVSRHGSDVSYCPLLQHLAPWFGPKPAWEMADRAQGVRHQVFRKIMSRPENFALFGKAGANSASRRAVGVWVSRGEGDGNTGKGPPVTSCIPLR